MTTRDELAGAAAHAAPRRRPRRSRTYRSRTSCAASRDRCCAASRSSRARASRTASSARSGCGKSTTAYAAVRYLPRNGVITGGRILVDGDDITKMSDERGPPVPDPPRLDGLPGPGAALNPSTQDRAAGRRGVHGPRPELEAGRGERACGRSARPDRRPGARVRRTATAPAVRRDAAARRHRHRARLRPEAARSSTSRRPGSTPPSRRASSTSCAQLQAETERGGPADRPQPRRHPDAVRSGRRHVRRQDRRGGRRGDRLRATRSIRTRSGCCARCPATAFARHERALSTIPATCPQIGTTCRPACSSTAARSADELCRTVVPPVVEVAATATGRVATTRDRLRRDRRAAVDRRRDTVDGDARARRCSKRVEDLPPERPRRAGAGRGSTSSCSTARPSGSSASRAPASRPWPRRSSASRARTPAAASSSTAARSRPIGEPRRPTDKRSIQMVFQNPDSALNRGWTRAPHPHALGAAS